MKDKIIRLWRWFMYGPLILHSYEYHGGEVVEIRTQQGVLVGKAEYNWYAGMVWESLYPIQDMNFVRIDDAS